MSLLSSPWDTDYKAEHLDGHYHIHPMYAAHSQFNLVVTDIHMNRLRLCIARLCSCGRSIVSVGRNAGAMHKLDNA